MRERRRYPRREEGIAAIQRIGCTRLSRRISNLSTGGFFVEERADRPELGELVVMELSGAEGVVCVTGEVVDVRPDGFGVQITRADWSRLSQLCKR